jgi:PAS domain-containing protein
MFSVRHESVTAAVEWRRELASLQQKNRPSLYGLRSKAVPAPKRKRKSQGEAVRTGRDGSTIPEEVYLTAPGDRELACCAQDILERERAEDALRKSEERYRLLFESIPQPTWVFDAETLSFLTVNEAAVRLYGYTREEFSSMTINDIRSPASSRIDG